MAKCSKKLECLFGWLRELKTETGLTRKNKKEDEEKINITVWSNRVKRV